MAKKTNKSKFAAPQFHDENAARDWFEAARWPEGPVCGGLEPPMGSGGLSLCQ